MLLVIIKIVLGKMAMKMTLIPHRCRLRLPNRTFQVFLAAVFVIFLNPVLAADLVIRIPGDLSQQVRKTIGLINDVHFISLSIRRTTFNVPNDDIEVAKG